MAKNVDEITEDIRKLPDVEKDNLAAGEPLDRILKNYPTLKAKNIQAVLQYAAKEVRYG